MQPGCSYLLSYIAPVLKKILRKNKKSTWEWGAGGTNDEGRVQGKSMTQQGAMGFVNNLRRTDE